MAECDHNEECEFIPRTMTPSALPIPDAGGGGGGGHNYTFSATATGWQVKEDGRVIYTYTDKNDNTTYEWQATTEGWVVKDNTGKVVFTYTDKSGENTTYSFEQTDDCGIKVTDNNGKVVFEYENNCAGTTYTFEQKGVDFIVTNDKTGAVVFTYKGTVDTNTTYHFENYNDGFKATDSDGVVAFVYDPELGKLSDGSYGIDTLLTTVFKGHTNISVGQIQSFNPADLVVGETLVYDGVGTVGVITKDNGDGTYQVTTMTISPGSRQGVRLGSVEEETDLPKTCEEAEALGWQTPQLGDFAYVTKGGEGDVISEYLVTDVSDTCDLTWAFSHSFNAGDYQEQSSTSMSGMILVGGAVQGTFGTPIDPSTLIRGVMRNGVLLTPDAQGKVNVVVDDSHIIVNSLPTTGIVDKAEYLVINANQEVESTWVHSPAGWFKTYEKVTAVVSHQIVAELPNTGIQEGVEYVVVDGTKVVGTWVYDPAKGWLQTEKDEKFAHVVVTELPATNIDDHAEYVVVEDLDDAVETYKATYVHTASGWVKTGENQKKTAAHIVVTELPTTDIVESAEYVVMTNPTDPTTFTGTWVRVNGNWVQTEKLEGGFHIVTSLPTSNIDDKNDYIVVEDLAKPDETLLGHYAYDKATNKWISLNSKYEVLRGLSINGYTTNADDFQDSPVGNVISFFGKKAPAHYLICNGATYNIGQYPELEAFFIEQYGKVNQFGGNGTTTWAVPDLRGEFLRGSGTNSRANQGSGAGVGEHQNATFGMFNGGDPNKNVWFPYGLANPQNPDSAIAMNGGFCYSADKGNYTQNIYSTRPTNTSALFCIKAESTYAVVPNDKFAVEMFFNGAAHSNQWYAPRRAEITKVTGNADLLINKTSGTTTDMVVFQAPVNGFYLATFMHPWSQQASTTPFWAAIHKNNPNYLDGNTAAAVGPYEVANNSMTNQRDGSTVSTVVYLEKGDTLAAKAYASAFTNLRFAVALVQASTVVNTAEAMLKPNTWAAGVEQDFGDGVYGKRYVGTTAAYTIGSTPVRNDFRLDRLPVGIRFISFGGSLTVSNKWEWVMPGAWGSTGQLQYAASIYHNTGAASGGMADLNLDITNSTSSSGDKYDIWVLYTKS